MEAGQVAKLAVGPIPLYHQLEQDISARLESGEFEPGDPLPTEEQICASYGVSRITVRKALDSLIQQGRIIRKRGVGSFVAESKGDVHSIHLSGSLDEFLQTAHQLTPRVLSLAPQPAPGKIARIFGVEKGTELLHLELVSSGGEGPLAHCEFYFPAWLIGRFETGDITNSNPIVRIIERKFAVRIARASQVIEPTLAGRDTAVHLGIPADTPVLQTQRTYYTVTGEPIEVATLRHHPQRYRYEVELRAKPHSV